MKTGYSNQQESCLVIKGIMSRQIIIIKNKLIIENWILWVVTENSRVLGFIRFKIYF